MEILINTKQIETLYSDEDLFVMMSFREENEAEAKEAFRLFYNRYKNLLWSLCYGLCRKLDVNNGKELAEYIFTNTMIAIYEHPTYDSSKSKLSTWMSKIAYHEALDLINGHKINDSKNCVSLNETMAISTSEDVDSTRYSLPQRKVLDDALNTLTEREKEILLICMMHQEPHKHLSYEVLNELGSRFGTTPANVRQIKKRALDKLKAYVSQNSNFLNN